MVLPKNLNCIQGRIQQVWSRDLFWRKGYDALAAISLMPEDNNEGFRPDVIALLKELDSPICAGQWKFCLGLWLEDGIGNPDARPTHLGARWFRI